MKTINCGHMKDQKESVFITEVNGVEFWLCPKCYEGLFIKMLEQMILEHQVQKMVNSLLDERIEKLEGRINQMLIANARETKRDGTLQFKK